MNLTYSLDDDQASMENEDDFESKAEEYDKLSLNASDWTLETLFGQIAKGNIELSPSFQRREVWDKRKKSLFIESLILGIPVPQIVLAQKKELRGKYIVLDGKQRLLSIYDFYNADYSLDSLQLLSNLNGLSVDKLDESYRNRLDNSTIRTVRLSGWESDSVLYTIFHRLNTGSVQLNTQELRSALFHGPYTSFASSFTTENLELAQLFNRKASAPDFRMRDVELLTRYCGIINRAASYNGNLKTFLDDTTQWLNSLNNENAYLAYANQALQSIELCKKLYEAIAKQVGVAYIPAFSLIQEDRGFRFNRAVFDSLCYALQDAGVRDAVISKIDIVADAARSMLVSEGFILLCSSSTKTPRSLADRVDAWSSLLASVLGISTKTLLFGGEKIEQAAR